MTSSSWSHGWKNTCLTLLNRISVISGEFLCKSKTLVQAVLTDLLRTDGRLVPEAILVDLNFTRKPLSVKGRSDEDFRKAVRSAALDLLKSVLLNDIRHFFLLLLAFVNLLFKVGNLLCDRVKTMLIHRAVSNRANECGVRVFEGLYIRVSGTA